MTYYKVIYHKEALKFIKQNKTIARFFIKMFEDIANDYKSSFLNMILRLSKVTLIPIDYAKVNLELSLKSKIRNLSY